MKFSFIKFLIAVILSGLFFTTCNQSDEGSAKKIDSLLLVLTDYQQREKTNLGKITEYDQQINQREEEVKKLQAEIDSIKRSAGNSPLSKSQQKKLRDKENQINKLLTENNQLMAKLNALASDTARLNQIIREYQLAHVDTVKIFVKDTGYQMLLEDPRKLKVTQISSKLFYKGLFKKLKNVELIEFSLIIHENLFAVPGSKSIYLRLVQPNGEILGMEPDIDTGNVENNIVNTSAKQFEYKNERMLYNLEWRRNDVKLSAGSCKVEYYIDGYLAGEGKLEIKK